MAIRIHLSSAKKPTIMLRLRHPQKMRIIECEVEGGECERIDAQQEVVRLKPDAEELVVMVRFGVGVGRN